MSEIGIDQLQDPFRWIGVRWQLESERLEVWSDVTERTAEAHPTFGEKVNLVKYVEGRSGRLVDGSNNN
jgi:hypothetical protein